MTTDGLLDVLQGDWRRLVTEAASATAIASVAALCGVLASSLRCCEFWYYRRTRRAFAWGAAVGIGVWLVTLFGAQFLALKSPQAAASWHDNRGLWILRLVLASGAAGFVAFQAHQRMLWLGERVSPAPLKASFRLRHLLVMQGLVAIVVCGWLVNVRARLAKASWATHLRQREQLAKELFEPYGFEAELTKRDFLFLHPMTDQALPVTDSTLEQLVEFGRVHSLVIRSDSISHEGLATLARLEDLRDLRIISECVTPDGAAALARCPSLWRLSVDCPSFEDDAAAELSKSASLISIELRNAPLTDQGLLNLAATRNLSSLRLHHSWVTPDGVARFAKLRSDVRLSLHPTVAEQRFMLEARHRLFQPSAPRQRPNVD